MSRCSHLSLDEQESEIFASWLVLVVASKA